MSRHPLTRAKLIELCSLQEKLIERLNAELANKWSPKEIFERFARDHGRTPEQLRARLVQLADEQPAQPVGNIPCPNCRSPKTRDFDSAILPRGPKRECLDCETWWKV